MTERKETVSKNLVENVIATLGTQSKKPNSVSMAINDDFVLDALGLFRDKKKGIERETGLVRLELVAVYVDEDAKEVENNISMGNMPGVFMQGSNPITSDPGEQKIMDMTDELIEATEGSE